MDDWLKEQLDEYQDDEYLVFDCPGERLDELLWSEPQPGTLRRE